MKILINLDDKQYAALQSLMDQDLATNRTAYFGYLIAQEIKARNKPKAGRPRKDTDQDEDGETNYDNDVPKNIPYYGEMIGPREYADKEQARAGFSPKG